MEWVVGVGVVILVVVAAAIMAAGTPQRPADDDVDPDERPYEWGDELHEFSYRHPWEDE